MALPMTEPDPILKDVERFLRRSRMSPTAFGREAAKDPKLVFELRQGRECRRALRDKLQQFMRTWRPTEDQRVAS